MEQKVFFIKSTHTIYEDSYKVGELGFANSYDRECRIFAHDYKEALKRYCESILYYPLENPENLEYVEDYKCFEHSWLVNEDSTPRSDSELKAWEKGILKLYCDNVSFAVYEMFRVVENK